MKILFKFLCFISLTFIVGCDNADDLTEQEVYNIINEIIADDSLSIHRACWEFQNISLSGDFKKEFTQQDISFIDRQKELFENLKIKPNQLKWRKRLDSSFRYTSVDTACNSGILYHISFPLVSVDRQKVLIEFQEDCNCVLGGQGGKDLYIKQSGHWKREKSFDQWISKN